MGAFFIIPSPGRETSRQRRLQGTQRKEERIGGRRKIDGGREGWGDRQGARARNRVKKKHGVKRSLCVMRVCALAPVCISPAQRPQGDGGRQPQGGEGVVNGAGIGA